MSLASDEILVELLPNCGGLHRIAALSIFADDVKSSNIIEQAKAIKGRVHSELETILSFQPDLVIGASFNRGEVITALRQKNKNILVLQQFSSADDIAKNILDIGDAINCKTQAFDLREKFLKKINQKTSRKGQGTQRIRLINFSPDLILMGRNTLFDDMVKRAGGINLTGDRGLAFWPKIDPETLLSFKPDQIVILDQDNKETRQQIQNHTVWKRLSAVENGRFIFVPAKDAWSTSHFFANAVENLSNQLSNLEK